MGMTIEREKEDNEKRRRRMCLAMNTDLSLLQEHWMMMILPTGVNPATQANPLMIP